MPASSYPASSTAAAARWCWPGWWVATRWRRARPRAGGYLGQSQEQVSALLQTLGLLPEDREPPADPGDVEEFEGDVLVFHTPPAEPPPEPVTEPAPAPEPVPEVSSLAIPDYDNLSASQVVPRLGGLSDVELDAVRRYEAAERGRKTILNKIAQLRSA